MLPCSFGPNMYSYVTHYYVCTYVCEYMLEDTMKAAVSLSSLQLLEVSNFLDYVKAKFSEVLLPVDTITKQELLGKGYKNLCIVCVY